MDFLNHLLDAPLANILIVAGLIFLGVGAVGKVTGKIDTDRVGRVMASLLGLVLLGAGVLAHVRADKPIPPKSSVQPTIHVFTVAPNKITKGAKVTIKWDVLNADDVELGPFGRVSVSGEREDWPQQDTIYTLTATNRTDGQSSTLQDEVQVREMQAPPSSRKASTQQQGSNDSVLKSDSVKENASDTAPLDLSIAATTEGTSAPQDMQPVYALQAPPTLPDYDLPSPPAAGEVWTPGSWYYSSERSDYYWVQGSWVVPPSGNLWTPPYWEYESGRYCWHAGYWAAHVGFYGRINYGHGYSGFGYKPSEIGQRRANQSSRNGGPDRTTNRATQAELIANRDSHLPALRAQVEQARLASTDKSGFLKTNHGRPTSLAAGSSSVASNPTHPSLPTHDTHNSPMTKDPRGTQVRKKPDSTFPPTVPNSGPPSTKPVPRPPQPRGPKQPQAKTLPKKTKWGKQSEHGRIYRLGS